MRDPGYIEGKDYAVEWRFADEQYERFATYVQELLRLKIDVIVAFNTRGLLRRKGRPRPFR
jgi:putative ABC transport system substrate-binding protein